MRALRKQPLPDGRGSDWVSQCIDQSRDRQGAVVGQALPPANSKCTKGWQAEAPAPRHFDHLAARYDALWTTTAIGRAQRDLVWRDVDTLFQSGERILDVGCGTGEDAAHFAARGVTVYATDASPAMVQVAKARGGFTAAVCSAEELAQIGGTFDGAISNFGALNCVASLPAVADSLAGLVRPGGRVAICMLGRFCAWETLYYGARWQWCKALRRWCGRAQLVGQVGNLRRVGNPPGAGCQPARRIPSCPTEQSLTVYYPTVPEVRAAFAPDFQLQGWTGIGLCVPPSYVKLPAALVACLAACDQVLARLPLLRALADHRLFLLVRK
jgi:ubiquinone/menaquinone biosynthesis C-methylase UbiE